MVEQTLETPVPIIDSSQKKSSKLWIYVAVIVVILILSLGGYKFLYRNSVTVQNQVANNLPTATPTPDPNVPTNNSNTQLDKDTQTINSDTTNLTNDLNNIDQGLNDQSIDLN